MAADFYNRHAKGIIIASVVVLPLLTILGEQIPSNNDIDTWLPRDSASRVAYDDFYRTFGADETILIAFERPFPKDERLAAFTQRLLGLEGVANCWSRRDVIDVMTSNSVSQSTANQRLVNLMSTPEDRLETILLTINEYGSSNRSETIQRIRGQLAYCSMNNAIVAGGPIVADQLDKLGNRQEAMFLFTMTLIICYLLLWANIGCWKTSGGLMLANILCIEATLATLWTIGMEMNFIMSCLPVMVMVFTTAAAVHFIGHYRQEYHRSDAVAAALKGVLRPAFFAAVTTIIGLISLAISDVGPVPAFGVAAAIGTFYSFLIGVFLTPAVLLFCQYRPPTRSPGQDGLSRMAMAVVNRPWQVMIPGITMTAVCAVGVMSLRSHISPIDFLPDGDRVRHDNLLIQDQLTSPTSIEAVIDFGEEGSSFVERLRAVRDIERQLEDVDNICHVLSLADFFPEELSEEALSLSRLASAASGRGGTSGLVADGSRLWRLSLRVDDDYPAAVRQTMNRLESSMAGQPISFTGLGPLLEEAQSKIFLGFWKSFASAFALITIVMMLALRSIRAGLVAMIPNLTPILLVFGTLGWVDFPVDIGIMMTASIALGLAVDGTFHFLFSYIDSRRDTGCRYRAVRQAMLQTGFPIICSAVICGFGLLALAFSPFKPTMRFGILMFLLLQAALIGDLLLLPSFLAIGARRKSSRVRPKADDVPPKRLAA